MFDLTISTIFTACIVSVIVSARSQTLPQACNIKNNTTSFAEELIEDFGENGRLTLEQFIKLSDHVRLSAKSSHEVSSNHSNSLFIQCPTVEEIFNLYNDGKGLTNRTLPQALFSLVYIVVSGNCLKDPSDDDGTHKKPTSSQVWGYGMGFVTLVCIISNIGGVLSPLMKKPFFQRLLTFLVAMAIGTLAATGLLVLLPEAFDLMSRDKLVDGYLWKSATAVVGIYIFYMSERILKILFYRPKKEDFQTLDVKLPLSSENAHGHSHLPANITEEMESGERSVSTVAWMVLIGDALHNFVDGLSIGAAFTENIYTGVSVSIAVVCEELPHELGDIAILLHSGLSMKRALCYNFLAAIVCYAGLIIGILLGENTSANRWIFAIAGGLFLYVSLVDMLPELSHTADEFQRQGVNPWKIMLIQNSGLVLGFGIILVVAYYAAKIVIDG